MSTTALRLAEPTQHTGRRYVPKRLSGALHWGIFDTHLNGWCSLLDGNAFVGLEWKTKEDAQVWLYLCRVAWGNGLVPPPEGWNNR